MPRLRRLKFCDLGCRDPWAADRLAGLIRPPYKVETIAGPMLMGWDQYHLERGLCPTCSADLAARVRQLALADRRITLAPPWSAR